MALAYVALGTILLVTHFIFPNEPEAFGLALWGATVAQWRDLEAIAFVVFTLLVLLHLILHWTWVCGYVATRLSKRWERKVTLHESAKTVWGVSILILVITVVAAIVLVAELSVHRVG
ncbi:MAG: hypothetical protein ACE5E5_07555 [Phycisphaerae bacterium]